MGKEIVSQVQEVQRIQGRINPKRNTLRNTVIKLTKIKDKDKISKAIRENNRMGKTRDLFKNIRDTKETFLEKAKAPHSSTLAWKIHGRRSLVGCRLWGRTESDTIKVT